jgi:Protein of unknown function (DUF732)
MSTKHAPVIVGGLLAVLLGFSALSNAPRVAADVVGYLVNVTVRPGYDFPNADAAVAYGRGICAQVAGGRGYPDVMAAVNGDFGSVDEYQASYLITQAVGELCPAQIWQLRESAAGYRPENRNGAT